MFTKISRNSSLLHSILIKILKIFSHFPFALELCRGLSKRILTIKIKKNQYSIIILALKLEKGKGMFNKAKTLINLTLLLTAAVAQGVAAQSTVVGSTPAEFNVSGGSASYSISIQVAPGRGGMRLVSEPHSIADVVEGEAENYF
jgi:hypothetical protein